jgi:hypothetical protein
MSIRDDLCLGLAGGAGFDERPAALVEQFPFPPGRLA